MLTITLEDIQRDLAGYLHRVQLGETLIVTEADCPLVEIKSAAHIGIEPPNPRPFGLCAGEFTVPDDFDAPLPEEILEHFERG